MRQQVNITMTLLADTAVDMGDLEENLKSAAAYHGGKENALVEVTAYDYKEEAAIYGNEDKEGTPQGDPICTRLGPFMTCTDVNEEGLSIRVYTMDEDGISSDFPIDTLEVSHESAKKFATGEDT